MKLRCRLGLHLSETSRSVPVIGFVWCFEQYCACGAKRRAHYGLPPQPREYVTPWVRSEDAAREEGA